MKQETIETATASVSAASAGGAWIGWVASANEVLILIATVIAIVSGGWTLYNRYKHRGKNASSTDVQPRIDKRSSE